MRIHAYLLLLLYLFIFLKPVGPYIAYLARKDYIIEKFCINTEKPEMQCGGKCHLEKQVKEAHDKSDDEPLPTPTRNGEEELQEFVLKGHYDNNLLQVSAVTRTKYLEGYSFQFVSSIFRPPMRR